MSCPDHNLNNQFSKMAKKIIRRSRKRVAKKAGKKAMKKRSAKKAPKAAKAMKPKQDLKTVQPKGAYLNQSELVNNMCVETGLSRKQMKVIVLLFCFRIND